MYYNSLLVDDISCQYQRFLLVLTVSEEVTICMVSINGPYLPSTIGVPDKFVGMQRDSTLEGKFNIFAQITVTQGSAIRVGACGEPERVLVYCE